MTRKTREEMKIIARQQLEERNLVAEQAARIAKLEAAILEKDYRIAHVEGMLENYIQEHDTDEPELKICVCDLCKQARPLRNGGAS